MFPKITIALLISLLLLTGCITFTEPEQEFELAEGQSARVMNANITITLEGLVVEVRTEAGEERTSAALSLFYRNTEQTVVLPIGGETVVGGYTIRVNNLADEGGVATVTLFVFPSGGGSE